VALDLLGIFSIRRAEGYLPAPVLYILCSIV
jgi:hypothetical protein